MVSIYESYISVTWRTLITFIMYREVLNDTMLFVVGCGSSDRLKTQNINSPSTCQKAKDFYMLNEKYINWYIFI